MLQPCQQIACIVAGYSNLEQRRIVEYLRTENAVLWEKLGHSHLRLNDDQRRRRAAKGKMLGRKLPMKVATLFTPDTILRWHRLLIAGKWDYSGRRTKTTGRLPVAGEGQGLVMRLANENPSWGTTASKGRSPTWATCSRTERWPRC